MSRVLLAGDARDSSALAPAARRWELWPVSIVAHTLLVGWLFVMPLVAPVLTPALPSPFLAYIAPPEVPAPPAPRRVSVREVPDSLKPQTAAPTEAPSGIPAETGIETTPPGSAEYGLDPGAVIGIEHGLPPEPAPPPPLPPAPPVRVNSVVAPTRVVYVEPVYPPHAIAARMEGVVIIEATISQDGRVEDARVLRSAPLLDEAALDAVRQWRYTPTRLNGVPVRIIMTVTVRFTLKKEV